jgi:hypothetical protein
MPDSRRTARTHARSGLVPQILEGDGRRHVALRPQQRDHLAVHTHLAPPDEARSTIDVTTSKKRAGSGAPPIMKLDSIVAASRA